MLKIRIYVKAWRHPAVLIQRAKYKHWFHYGEHRPTDLALKDAVEKNEMDIKFILPKDLL